MISDKHLRQDVIDALDFEPMIDSADIGVLAEDSVVMLDRLIDEPLDVLVNGKLIAKGEVIAEGTRFGLRIVELVGNRGDAPRDRRAPPIQVAPVASGAKPEKAA